MAPSGLGPNGRGPPDDLQWLLSRGHRVRPADTGTLVDHQHVCTVPRHIGQVQP